MMSSPSPSQSYLLEPAVNYSYWTTRARLIESARHFLHHSLFLRDDVCKFDLHLFCSPRYDLVPSFEFKVELGPGNLRNVSGAIRDKIPRKHVSAAKPTRAAAEICALVLRLPRRRIDFSKFNQVEP
jgi:hypothetical protein